MIEVLFHYDGNIIIIQCNIKDKMKDIIQKFIEKVKKEEYYENFYYLYEGNKINQELTFIEQVNEVDKKNYKMNIIVKKYSKDKNEIKENISKDIICPKCKELAILNIEDFKFNFHCCNNYHIINKVLLNEFEECQKIDKNRLICNICNKQNIFNNIQFFICIKCNKIICTLCKLTHDKNHILLIIKLLIK